MSRTIFLIPLIACTIGISTFASQNDKKSDKEAGRKNFSDRMNWHYVIPNTPESADQPNSAIEHTVEKSLEWNHLTDKVEHIVHCSGFDTDNSNTNETSHALNNTHKRTQLADTVNSRFYKQVQSPSPAAAPAQQEYSDDAVKKELLTLFKQGMSFENLPLLQNASAQEFQQYVNDHYATLVAKAIKNAEKKDSASHSEDNKHKRICMALSTLKHSYHPLKQRRDLVADYDVEARDERNVKEYDEKLIIINNIKPCLSRSIAQRLLPTSYHLHILPARYKCALSTVCGFALIGAYTIFSSFFCNKKMSQHTPAETNDNLHV